VDCAAGGLGAEHRAGQTYDSEAGEGARIWSQVQLALARRLPMEHAFAEHRYGKPILVQPRLGQGAFRLLVTDAYQRRCAVTGERTLPVLDAAHIRPYAELGPHKLDNGILLTTSVSWGISKLGGRASWN
jgi:putative restriction endonuclease